LDPEVIVPISRETTEVFKTGSWSSIRPRFIEKTSPCRSACPIGNNISAAARAAAEGDFDAALAAFLEESPLPGVCGRVCYHPCQNSCNRTQADGAVQVRALERAAADFGKAAPKMLSNAGKNSPIAVIGSGPAGLSCAYHLARMGHPVTVFESAYKPGGLLANGIPEFRLPKDVLEKELSRIWELGVSLKTGITIDPAELEKLSQSHEAVFFAPGADAFQSLKILGENLDGVAPGLDFLRQPSLQQKAHHAEVVVIGGGNTALDAARTAVRAGARQVTILYRRTMDEMPAFADEVADAEAEGIVFKTLVAPTSFLGSHQLEAVRLVRFRLAEPEADGRPRPIPIEGTEENMTCDMAIIAAGQKPSDLYLNSTLRWEAGKIWVDAWNRTSQTSVFAGGDVTPAKASVVDAMATGKRAALGIHLQTIGQVSDADMQAVCLGSGPAFSLTAWFQRPENWKPDRIAVTDSFTVCMTPQQPPEKLPELDATERIQSSQKSALGYTMEAAGKEAARCLVCGTCVGCNRCMVFCPEGAVIPPEESGGEYLYRDEYCKGCCTCASVCLRGVMEPGESR
jgi:NADPH-dependent glutamate synthase beta subunit-like oxidoreductase